MFDPQAVVWYSRGRSSVDAGPSVSINKAGRVILSDSALSLYDEEPEALQVGVIPGSRGKTTLILQAAQKSDAGALAVTPQGKSKASVNTIRFLKDMGLEKLFASDGKVDFDKQHNALVVSF